MTSRCWDGSPETDAETRFFDLRDAGYTGWINQDGYAVDGPDFVCTAGFLTCEPGALDPADSRSAALVDEDEL